MHFLIPVYSSMVQWNKPNNKKRKEIQNDLYLPARGGKAAKSKANCKARRSPPESRSPAEEEEEEEEEELNLSSLLQ